MNQQFVQAINREVASLPEGFFSTFRYTTTGNNLCHPLTLGAIAGVVGGLPGVAHIAIDVRLNDMRGGKFQPDVVGYDQNLHPVVVVDYESPNSSDARVPVKDWLPFAQWRAASGRETPYLVVTTLPQRGSPEWELRWTASGQYNHEFSGQRDKIRRSPFEFWYRHYRSVAPQYDLRGVCMVNIDDGLASMVPIDGI
jgi:hypothetical protein